MSTKSKLGKIGVVTVAGSLLFTGIYTFANYELKNEFTEKFENIYNQVSEYVNKTDAEIKNLETNLESKTSELVTVTNERDSLMSELEEVKAELESALQQGVTDKDAIELLQSQKAEIQSQLDAKILEVENLESEVSRLEGELAAAQLKSEEDAQYIAYLENIVNDANDESAQLESDIAILLNDIVDQIKENPTKTFDYATLRSNWKEVSPSTVSNESVTTNTIVLDQNGNEWYYIQTVTVPNSNDANYVVYNVDGEKVAEGTVSIPLEVSITSNGVLKLKTSSGDYIEIK